MKRRTLAPVVLLAGAAALALSCSGGGEKKGASGGKGGPPAFPVETSPVKSRPVEYTVTAVGSVDAFEKVQVTARVAGVVEQVKFVEGESVETGTALVEIEPRRYQLAVEAARANVQKAEAAKADAEAALERRKAVVVKNPGLIPGEEIATFATRVQTAAADSNPKFHAIIKEFDKLTGCGVIINTSFNVRGEPIVCTPEDAYRCFMRTEMDYLVLGSFILGKKDQPEWKDKVDWRREYVLD